MGQQLGGPAGTTVDVAARYARASLSRFGLSSRSHLTPLRYGENGVFRVDTPQGRPFVLRVHRPGYQTPASIRSELHWMNALHEAEVDTARAVDGLDGDPVQSVSYAEDAPGRCCVLFEWVEGQPLGGSETPEVYELLGGIMAKMHRQAQDWSPPPGFTRHRWDEEGLVGNHPLFGRPEEATDWPDETLAMIDEARVIIRDELHRSGTDALRFGMIHADVTPWNIVLRDGTPYVFDFDDCGFGWYSFDIATSLWVHEGREDLSELSQALLRGYRRERDLSSEEEGMLPVFFMARRLAGLGWIHSRRETAHAQAQANARIAATPPALRRFLAWARTR